MRVPVSARGRLAILYTALVFAAGVVLAALTYVLVRRGLEGRPKLLVTYGGGPRPAEAEAAFETIDRLHDEILTQLLTRSAVALAIVTLLAAVLGWLVAGRVLRPIRAISGTARRLSAENLSERVPVTTPADELAELAETVNGMLDRIQSGIADRDRLLHGQRMFVANAAHELRTPLTTMRTAIDVTLDGRPGADELLVMAGDVRDAIVHGQRTLDGLLTLARCHTGPSEGHAVDLADVVAGIVGTVPDDVELRTDLGPAAITGDPVLLDRMVANLVDNAVRYNDTGGHVAVSTGTTAGHTRLRVANTGPLLDPDAVDGLVEPFVRGTATRTRTDGAGLGLSIVRAVVEAHGGLLRTTARPTGGLDVTVTFPAAHSSGNTVVSRR
ncbi:sensor histidine kinase [Saccharothrix sp. NRRL B-16348]|uniref:sensor histidine kinase n=1 Tax=Saccharothrix sp. NRRL B-16348 TaxID=1415542 RepID=UPI000A4CFD88|nr:HAMP domain-containing sensor histidine kinase [Saccharothrix sp. NRRL B-16348]